MVEGKIHLLVVDDSEDVRFLLSRLLESYGYSVSTADSGGSAFSWLSQNRADLVVADIQMPNGRGDELTVKLRTSGSQIPIFLFTASSDFTRRQALEVGANGLFRKPNELPQMPRAIEEFLSNAG